MRQSQLMLRTVVPGLFVAMAMAMPVLAGNVADTETDQAPVSLEISPASDEARQAISRVRVPDGFSLSLWASEPMLANPVAFCLDDQGRIYVAETFRLHDGVTDTRGHMNWLDDDLASTSVEDRVAMYRSYFDDPTFARYGEKPDRVRMLADTDGDGQADRSTVFATGFDDVAAGLGSGVLARDGYVWYTCIPHLWRLRDEDGDGLADVKESLSYGYGVHVSFLGHDLHGLTFGPDGKLYFSIGDRGLNVETKEGTRLFEPHSGSVLRCNPDGSNLEIVATGLRNPQELAFDRFGNLFTVDNNSDAGDQARLVNVVEGGSSGWHMGYQYLTEPVARGPWNAERLWRPRSEGNEAAYLLPPLANVSSGPSGLAYNPGAAAMPDRYDHHFFLADFRGTPANSGIRSFALEPDGAAFRMVDQHEFLWSILATDVDFALDGGLFVSDWVEGWDKPTKGRIYRLTPADPAADPTAAEVARLLAEGFDDRASGELIDLLGHGDQRVRQRAQFELADRGDSVIGLLTEAAGAENLMTRLHAVWALGQIGRSHPEALAVVQDRLDDPDPHVRGQAARLLGASDREAAADDLIDRLDDPAPRVRMYAAIALGKLGAKEAVAPLVALLRENDDRDAYLRHGGVMGLLGTADQEALDAMADDESTAVRLGALLVMRRRQHPEIARFLSDPDPRIVLEAARAINDVPIDGAMASLASLEIEPSMPEALLRRVLNANRHVGGSDGATALARIAARDDLPESIRVEALEILADWNTPRGRDRVVGLWRPIPNRPAAPAAEALRPVVSNVLAEAPDPVRLAAARAVGALGLKDVGPALFALFSDEGRAADARAEALRALEALEDSRLPEVARLAVQDKQQAVRTEGLRLLSDLAPEEAMPILDAVLQRGTTAEQQGALATLGGMKSEQADRLLSEWLDRLLADRVPAELRLDLLEAAARRSAADLREKLSRYEAARPSGDPLAPYRETLYGGNAASGRRIFFERTEAQCLRCHKIHGEGGEVGPDLSDIGARKDRRYILESLVAPDAQVAEGFETLVVATADGQVLSGIVKDDSGDSLVLMDAEGKRFEVPKDEIEESKRGVSAMPTDLLKNLSKRDIRDLVEYLSGLKQAR